MGLASAPRLTTAKRTRRGRMNILRKWNRRPRPVWWQPVIQMSVSTVGEVEGDSWCDQDNKGPVTRNGMGWVAARPLYCSWHRARHSSRHSLRSTSQARALFILTEAMAETTRGAANDVLYHHPRRLRSYSPRGICQVLRPDRSRLGEKYRPSRIPLVGWSIISLDTSPRGISDAPKCSVQAQAPL